MVDKTEVENGNQEERERERQQETLFCPVSQKTCVDLVHASSCVDLDQTFSDIQASDIALNQDLNQNVMAQSVHSPG